MWQPRFIVRQVLPKILIFLLGLTLFSRSQSWADPNMILESILTTGQSYLMDQKYSEARLAAIEAQELAQKHSFTADETTRIALLKTEALIGLNQLQEADQTLVHLPPTENTLKTKLKLKTIQCTLLGHPDKWAPLWKAHPHDSKQEGQLLDQLKRRGTCLEESLLLYRSILNLGLKAENPTATEAAHLIAAGYATYRSACLEQKMKKDTFRYELEVQFIQDFQHSLSQTLDLLKSWSQEKPPLNPVQKKSIEQLETFLNHFPLSTKRSSHEH